jgi:hypothetical protein
VKRVLVLGGYGGFGARLPPAVRAMHRVFGDAGAAGRGTVTRGRNPIARLIGAIMRFPPEGAHALHVAFAQEEGAQRWTRDFGGHRFASMLTAKGERIVERLGPLRFHFDLPSDETGLAMLLRRWSFCGVPLPMLLAPRIVAREWEEEEGDFRFDVAVGLPGIGEIVGYGGRLSRVEALECRN